MSSLVKNLCSWAARPCGIVLCPASRYSQWAVDRPMPKDNSYAWIRSSSVMQPCCASDSADIIELTTSISSQPPTSPSTPMLRVQHDPAARLPAARHATEHDNIEGPSHEIVLANDKHIETDRQSGILPATTMTTKDSSGIRIAQRHPVGEAIFL